jgi:hypothetical protein
LLDVARMLRVEQADAVLLAGHPADRHWPVRLQLFLQPTDGIRFLGARAFVQHGGIRDAPPGRTEDF